MGIGVTKLENVYCSECRFRGFWGRLGLEEECKAAPTKGDPIHRNADRLWGCWDHNYSHNCAEFKPSLLFRIKRLLSGKRI